MSETLAQLVDQLRVAVDGIDSAVKSRSWRLAEGSSRAGLSALGKLHQRLAALGSLAEEAGYAAAEVDRALARARRARPEAVEGDQPLPFPGRGGKRKPKE